MRQTRFQIAKKDIVTFFEENSTKIFSSGDISKILDSNRRYWRLSKSLTAVKFIDLLTTYTRLKKNKVNFPKNKITKYTWDKISIYTLALNLERKAYFTHYTALFLNNLTDQIPKTIYVNYEQPEKYNPSAKLTQDKIDRAFLKSLRISNNIAIYRDYKICLLNGKFTDRTGVIEIMTQENEKLSVTNIERTLIDIVVRPSYSGGIQQVLNAYKNAVGRVSINKLTAMLQKLRYNYPYHQAIGFYLQKAGVYRDSQIELLRKFDFKYDFYLTHQMKEREYSKEWRLYYPRGF